MEHSSKFTKLACALLVLSLILFFAAYVSNGWVKQTAERETRDNITDLHMGLWKTCFYDNGQQKTICHTTDRFLLQDWNEAWLPGVQTIFSTVLAMELLSVSVTVPFILSYQCSEGTLMIFVATCSSFASFALMFLGILIFGIQQGSDTVNFYDTKLDWAYGFTVVAAAFTGVACFLLVGEFYDILLVLAKRKTLRKQEQRIMEALDEATVTTQNTTRKYNRKPATENNQQSDNASIDSTSPLFKQTTSNNNTNKSQSSLTTGVTNPTYDSGGDQPCATSVRNRRTNLNEQHSGYIDDGHMPTTSNNDTHVNDNYLENTYNGKHSQLKPSYDSDSSLSDDGDDGKDQKQTAIVEQNVYNMFNASNLKQPSEAIKRSNANKSLPAAELFQAANQHPSNLTASETSSNYSTSLPPLGKPVLTRASYDNTVPTFSKSSKYYSTGNQLTKSTPTDLFMTSRMKSQDLTSSGPRPTPSDLFLTNNSKSQDLTTSSGAKSTERDNSRSQELRLSGAIPKKTLQSPKRKSTTRDREENDHINVKYDESHIDENREVSKDTMEDYYNELSVVDNHKMQKDVSKSKKRKKRRKSKGNHQEDGHTYSNPSENVPSKRYSNTDNNMHDPMTDSVIIRNTTQQHIYEELDEYSV